MSGNRQGPPPGWYDTGRKKSDGSPIYEKVKNSQSANGKTPPDSQNPMNDFPHAHHNDDEPEPQPDRSEKPKPDSSGGGDDSPPPPPPPPHDPPPDDDHNDEPPPDDEPMPPPPDDRDAPPDEDVPPDPEDPHSEADEHSTHDDKRIPSTRTYPNQLEMEQLKYFIEEELSEHKNITRIREVAIDTYNVPFEDGDYAEVEFLKDGQVRIDFYHVDEDGEGGDVESMTVSPGDAKEILNELADANGEEAEEKLAMVKLIGAQMAYKVVSRKWSRRRARKRREKQASQEFWSRPSRRLAKLVDMIFPKF